MKLKEIIFYEKSEMTPIRRKINYIVLPLLMCWMVLSLAAGGVLMTVDENKFVGLFLALLAVGVLPLCLLLPALPFIRKKEAEYELNRYAFLTAGFVDEACQKDKYIFETPSEDLLLREHIFAHGSKDSELECKEIIGEDDFFDAAREYVALTKEGIVWRKLKFFAADREGNVYNREYNRLEYSYAETKISLVTSNFLLRVRLSLLFEFSDGSFFVRPLTEDLFGAVRRFSLPIENKREFEYLLTHTQEAFCQILKYGNIRKIG